MLFITIEIFLIIILILLCGYFLTLYRNYKTLSFRLFVLRRISILADRDIANNKPWGWRYDDFNSISYSTMVLKFWKPLKSFYKNNSFYTREDKND